LVPRNAKGNVTMTKSMIFILYELKTKFLVFISTQTCLTQQQICEYIEIIYLDDMRRLNPLLTLKHKKIKKVLREIENMVKSKGEVERERERERERI
jgi:N-acetyl-beta-hexosaminidase